MKAFLLSVHVLAAVLCVGPITVAASIFPRYAVAAADLAAGAGSSAAAASAAAMHRIARVCAVLAISVPVFGIATAAAMGVLAQPWVLVSTLLTLVAGVLLAVGIVPQQRLILSGLAEPHDEPSGVLTGQITRLRMVTGTFGLIWTVVVVLMIIRPGSTTGV